jgi:hypothetical protein
VTAITSQVTLLSLSILYSIELTAQSISLLIVGSKLIVLSLQATYSRMDIVAK